MTGLGDPCDVWIFQSSPGDVDVQTGSRITGLQPRKPGLPKLTESFPGLIHTTTGRVSPALQLVDLVGLLCFKTRTIADLGGGLFSLQN